MMQDSPSDSNGRASAEQASAILPDGPNVQRFLQSLPAAAYTCDAQGRITFYNKRAEAVWGRSPLLNDARDRYCGSFKLYTTAGLPLRHDECWMALALKNVRGYNDKEIVVERADGERRTVLAHANPYFSDDGQLLGAVNVLVDITDRKRTEEGLQERLRQLTLVHELSTRVTRASSLEETYAAALEAILEATRAERASILLFDPDGVIRFKAWHGLSEAYRHAVEGHTPWRPDQPDASPICVSSVAEDASLEAFRAVILGEGIQALAFIPLVYEDRLLGKVMVYSDAPRAFTDADLRLAQTVTNHVAFAIGRRQAEQALLTSEQKLRTILDASTAVIFVKDPDGYYTVVNQAWADLFGMTVDDAIGKTDHDLFPESMARALRENDLRVLEADVPMRFEETAELQGRDPLIYLSVKFPLRDADGMVYGIGGVSTDITEVMRTQAALQESETRLRTLSETLEQRVAERTEDLARANQMLERRNQELQDFAHSASHDLQEPLRKFRTFLGLLRDEMDEPSTAALDYVRRMDSAAARMSDLIKALLMLSRVSTPTDTFRSTDLSEVLPVVLSDLEVTIADSRARLDVGPLTTLQADPLQMHQLLLNLVGNALKFARSDVSPVIKIWAEQAGEAEGGGAWSRIIVEDNGIGFENRYAERLFRPFQRLHSRDAYGGVGMGLAICRRIVERHGGSISARSKPGRGSRFEILLPIKTESADAPVPRVAGTTSSSVAPSRSVRPTAAA